MGTIAEKLNYLNTTKTNIKNAIVAKGVSVSENDTFRSYASKITDIEPTLGTKTITANGTYNASDDSLQGYSSVTVDIDDTDLYRDTTDSTYESVKTLSNCGAFPMLSLTAEINAVQDLHGYDHPWTGGAGKNLLPLDLDTIKSLNAIGTWSGNTYTYLGVLATFDVDDNGYVNSITLNGTAENIYELRLPNLTLADNSYILNGVTGGSASTYRLNLYETSLIVQSLDGDSPSFTADSTLTYRLYAYITSGATVTNVTIYPMIRLSTETDATFAPYSNICPITGWDEVNVTRCGKNIANPTVYKNNYVLASDGAENSVSGYLITALSRVRDEENISILFTRNGSDNLRIGWYDKDGNFISRSEIGETSNTMTTPSNAYYFRLSYNYRVISDIIIAYGTTATPYEAYNGQTHTTALSTTCYGGSKDIKGNEIFTHGHIASYNGETLPGAWISDRDEYAEGTTPTIGAEVVYELATPTTATSDTIDLTLAEGVNNLWADSGDVGDARYFKKVEL